MSIADRIGALRLEAGRSELDLANELGLTLNGYCNLERDDSEIESVLSIAQVLKLAKLLGTDVLGLLGEAEQSTKVPIVRVRSALAAHLGNSAEAREALEDVIDWDLGPFLEDSGMGLGVYDRVHQEIGASDRSGLANHSGGHRPRERWQYGDSIW